MDLGMDMWKYYGITHTDHTVMNPLSLEKTRELVGLLRLPEGGRVLDVACGDGYHMELLRNLGFRRIYGVDTDEEMLEIAAEKGLNVRYGTPYELDIQGAFDVIIMCDLIGYLEDPELALNKINTALKESGILYLSVPVYESLAEKLSRRRRETRPGSMSSQQVIYLLEKSGFELEHKLHTANRLPLS